MPSVSVIVPVRNGRACAAGISAAATGNPDVKALVYVDAFIPERVYTPPSANEQPERSATPQPSSVPRARLSPWWFVVPGMILSLIVLVPLSVVVVNWRRGVRAEKEYLRGLGEDRESSAP